MSLVPVIVPLAGTGVGTEPTTHELPEAPAAACVVAPAKANVELGCGYRQGQIRPPRGRHRQTVLLPRVRLVGVSSGKPPMSRTKESRRATPSASYQQAAISASAPLHSQTGPSTHSEEQAQATEVGEALVAVSEIGLSVSQLHLT